MSMIDGAISKNDFKEHVKREEVIPVFGLSLYFFNRETHLFQDLKRSSYSVILYHWLSKRIVHRKFIGARIQVSSFGIELIMGKRRLISFTDFTPVFLVTLSILMVVLLRIRIVKERNW